MEKIRIYKKGSDGLLYRDQPVKRGYHGQFVKQNLLTPDQMLSFMVGISLISGVIIGYFIKR